MVVLLISTHLWLALVSFAVGNAWGLGFIDARGGLPMSHPSGEGRPFFWFMNICYRAGYRMGKVCP